jgi:hypothetical protein
MHGTNPVSRSGFKTVLAGFSRPGPSEGGHYNQRFETGWRPLSAVRALCAFLVMIGSASAQPPDDLRIRYNSGQPVVPIFEGWQRNADGSFDLVFGYFNRNYVEEVIVPIGPANSVEPEGPDGGQPAYFYPRLNRFAFRITVPGDWGTRQVVWTLTVYGRNEKAYGSLAPIWEIDPVVEIQNAGGGGLDETSKGSPPRVSINPEFRLSPKAPSAPVGPATFAKDVAPILQRSCQSCHRPGTAAPMSLLTYEDARPWAAAIKTKVASREMPPWHIVRNVGIQKFKNDPSLSDDEIATIVRWVDGGAPPGNRADLPPPRHFADEGVWHIGKPDLIVTAKPYKVAAAGADWWAVFTVPSGLAADRYIKAIEAKPGSGATAKVVHHILAYAEDGTAPPSQATTNVGDDDFFQRGEFLVEYSVGKGGEHFPEGSGRLLKAGSNIRFEVHYHSVGEELTDASQVAFVFHPRGYVPKRIQRTKGLGHGGDIDIPGGSEYVRTDGYTRFDGAGVLTGFQPHMHARGKAECLELIYPTGGADERVEQIACARFEFGAATVYTWADDVAPIFPAGTILHVINWHENAASRTNPPPVNWVGNGNRTIDEMSFSWVSYYTVTNAEYDRLLAARRGGSAAARIPGGPAGPGPAAAAGRAAAADRASRVPNNVHIFKQRRPPAGMSVSAILYRGPAPVTFVPDGFTRVKSGEEFEITAIFTQPGTYVIRVVASDGMLRTGNIVTITVGDSANP